MPLACGNEIDEVLVEVFDLRIGLVADMGIGLGWRSIICVAAIWEKDSRDFQNCPLYCLLYCGCPLLRELQG